MCLLAYIILLPVVLFGIPLHISDDTLSVDSIIKLRDILWHFINLIAMIIISQFFIEQKVLLRENYVNTHSLTTPSSTNGTENFDDVTESYADIEDEL